MTTKPTYPKRPKFFAHRYCRLLTKTCACQTLGANAFVLCITIAHQEDAKRYKGAVTYYNEQLMPLVGMKKWDALDHARKRAAEHGWLHYEAGGRHKPGQYWVTIPAELDDLNDTPCDESRYPAKGDRGGELAGDRGGGLSTLTHNPIPKKKPAGAGDAPSGLLELIDGWNELPAGIVKQGNGARRDPPSKAAHKGWARAQKDSEQRESFSNVPRLLEAIERAKFCHGQSWFSLPWLFGTNRNSEFNVVKLLNGGHDGSGNTKSVRQDSPARIR